MRLDAEGRARHRPFRPVVHQRLTPSGPNSGDGTPQDLQRTAAGARRLSRLFLGGRAVQRGDQRALFGLAALYAAGLRPGRLQRQHADPGDADPCIAAGIGRDGGARPCAGADPDPRRAAPRPAVVEPGGRGDRQAGQHGPRRRAGPGLARFRQLPPIHHRQRALHFVRRAVGADLHCRHRAAAPAARAAGAPLRADPAGAGVGQRAAGRGDPGPGRRGRRAQPCLCRDEPEKLARHRGDGHARWAAGALAPRPQLYADCPGKGQRPGCRIGEPDPLSAARDAVLDARRRRLSGDRSGDNLGHHVCRHDPAWRAR